MSAAHRTAMRQQADACDRLGSPFTARLLRLLADRLDGETAVGARVLGWPGDPLTTGDAVALRLAGGLHALVLSGADEALARVYANPGLGDEQLWQAIACMLNTHDAHLQHWLDTPPQTNEPARSAVLIAAGHWLTARFGLELELLELGASAGLNLRWDAFALEVQGQRFGPADAALTLRPDWTGPPPPATAPRIAGRAGVDLNPLDPARDRLRILSYVWADQGARLARMRAALDLAAKMPVEIAQGDAAEWLEQRLDLRRPGVLQLVYHTVVWQYLSPETDSRARAAMARAGAAGPLARLGMEQDHSGQPGAAIWLDLWPGGRVDLGRADFHGRWVDWQAPAPG
ncbi:DUF2332 family protein [Rhodobacteraceae bacterium 2376]|uniref:DUF2332 family protein n=1 Tax=Rhabdonatronobacter sediminivivens TaxID=2743469 RepID=A0A7Z0I0M6_9RHOB|nr:DUF2332 family protein [Rhabdonatronobacter sediminivivens]NYS25472.1 DUF2332 family protein [Rhabdonatronobacter sediminivivens]